MCAADCELEFQYLRGRTGCIIIVNEQKHETLHSIALHKHQSRPMIILLGALLAPLSNMFVKHD